MVLWSASVERFSVSRMRDFWLLLLYYLICFAFYFHWIGPLGRFSHRVAMSVCLWFCLSVPLQNTHFPVLLRALVEEQIPNIALWSHNDNSSLLCVKGLIYIWKMLNTLCSCNVIQVEGSKGGHQLYLNALHGCKVKLSKYVKSRESSPLAEKHYMDVTNQPKICKG